MPKTLITEYECSMCSEHVLATGLPVGWYEMFVTTEGGRFKRSNEYVLCPTHGTAILNTPSELLHPGLEVKRGLANHYSERDKKMSRYIEAGPEVKAEPDGEIKYNWAETLIDDLKGDEDGM